MALRGERFQISAAGFAELTDWSPQAAPLPCVTAIRETREETGVHVAAEAISAEAISFEAPCRTKVGFAIGLYGSASLAAEPEALAPQLDAFEVSGYEWWPWEQHAMFARVRAEGGWRCSNVLGAATIVHALARCFGEAEVRAAWEAARAAGRSES